MVEETSALREIEVARRQGDYLVEMEVERSVCVCGGGGQCFMGLDPGVPMNAMMRKIKEPEHSLGFSSESANGLL